MIRAYSFSAAGGHAVNEDAFVLQPFQSGAAWLAALADGQGGRSGGRRAAQLACETAIREALELPTERRGDARSWAEVLGRADAAVAADRDAGFATLVGLYVEENRVVGASCGDSAALAVGPGGLMRVLTAHQFKNPPVGSGEADFAPFELELTPPWRVLLMSDGVWKYATWERVCDRAARLSGEELIAELQDAARLKVTGEFQDDFTVLLLESE
jgi:serine/threonine protein phosphatase PrpC